MNAEQARRLADESRPQVTIDGFIRQIDMRIKGAAMKGGNEIVAPLNLRTPITVDQREAVFSHYREQGFTVVRGKTPFLDVISW